MGRTRGHAETSNIPDYGHNIQPATALGQVMGRRFPLMPSDWVFGFIYFPLPVALDSLRKYHWLAAPFCFPKCSGKSPHELCLSAYKLSIPRKKPQTARGQAAAAAGSLTTVRSHAPRFHSCWGHTPPPASSHTFVLDAVASIRE